jgi:hypothetical protein
MKLPLVFLVPQFSGPTITSEELKTAPPSAHPNELAPIITLLFATELFPARAFKPIIILEQEVVEALVQAPLPITISLEAVVAVILEHLPKTIDPAPIVQESIPITIESHEHEIEDLPITIESN